MPRQKGTGTKEKLSVTVDKDIVDKLDRMFKGSDRGGKSEFVNRILKVELFPSANEIKSAGPDQSITFEVSAARKEVEK
jgi:metal-responsive CopG/Arc/MetJ family transcriptional regulator